MSARGSSATLAVSWRDNGWDNISYTMPGGANELREPSKFPAIRKNAQREVQNHTAGLKSVRATVR
jgi:hypothetical protein